ncbi:MAG: hypothetical protein DDT36_01593 [Firmicutes bacterium]|nr:hypothetical protein [Bacillota bacterium]
MITQLVFAFRDIWRKPVIFGFFAIQLVVALFFGFVSLDQVRTSVQHTTVARGLADSRLVFFSPNIATLPQRRLTPTELMVTTLDESQRAYSVVTSVKLQDYPSLNVVVGLGAFAETFRLAGDLSAIPKPIAFVGHDVDVVQVGGVVEFGERNTENIAVRSRLPRGASYILRGTPTNLDDSLVILVDAKSVLGYFFNSWQHFDEIMVNMCLVDPTGAELAQFVSRILNDAGVALNPIDLNAHSRQVHDGNFYGALFFLVFFGITMVYTLVGIVVNMLQLIDSHLSEYAIHLLSGARMWHLYARVFIYVFVLVSPPVMLVSWFFLLMHQMPMYGLVGVVPPLICLILLLAGFPILKLYKTDLFAHLRSDDQWH